MPMYAYDPATGYITAYVFSSSTFRATKEAQGLAVLESDQRVDDIRDYMVSVGELVKKTEADLLLELRYKKQGELLANINHFIEHKPNGTVRYDANLKMNVLYAFITAILTSAAPSENTVLVATWIQTVQARYFVLKQSIADAETISALEAIDISIATLEAQYGVGGSVAPDPDKGTADL